ncbi:MAG: penicillin acylase family protein, partial [Sandaracinaceae bacterium]
MSYSSSCRVAAACLLYSCVLAACDGTAEPPPTDAGADASVDAGGPDAGRPFGDIPSLTTDVRALRDHRGFWHIYGSDFDDVTRVQGYLHARDRFGQLIFLRRAARGELTEIIPAELSPSIVEQDRAARVVGYRRHAEATWVEIQASAPDTAARLQAYADGVNAFIDEVERGDADVPRGVADFFRIIQLDDFKAWEPVDSLAIGKLLAASISLSVTRDLDRTLARDAFEATFTSSAADPRLAARAGTFLDLYPFVGAERAYTMDGFPASPPSAIRARPFVPRTLAPLAPLTTRASLTAATRFAASIEAPLTAWFGDPDARGSNSWVIDGAHTASGHPMLANDPHLALPSPALHWFAHLDTTEAGGDIDMAGLVFAGIPFVLFGFNDHIAWAGTVGRLDLTDTYAETIVTRAGMADAVLFDPDPDDANPPEEREIIVITESLRQRNGAVVDMPIELVPVGPTDDPTARLRVILPPSRTPTSAISLLWSGFGATREAVALDRFNRAASVEEAIATLDDFDISTINWSFIDQDEIYWRSTTSLPVRDPRALAMDHATGTGNAPCYVMPGTGEYEWLRGADATLGADARGMLESRYLPQLRNPASGFILTANGDPVGVTDDDDPFNDALYLGWRFESHRMARLADRLGTMVAAGDVTPEDAHDLQADFRSPVGALTRDAVVAELDRALAEAATPGTHADLAGLVSTTDATRLMDARERLVGWSLVAESGVSPEGVDLDDASRVLDSTATAIFNASMTRIHRGLVDDEVAAMIPECDAIACARPTDAFFVIALSAPERLRSYDVATGDTVYWDDVSTPEVETRGVIVVRAVLDALDWLTTRFGSPDPTTWRWGRLHTIRFVTTVPQLG